MVTNPAWKGGGGSVWGQVFSQGSAMLFGTLRGLCGLSPAPYHTLLAKEGGVKLEPPGSGVD